MSQNDKLLDEVTFLLSHSLEGDLPADQYEYFKNLLRKDRQAREYYYRLIAIHAMLQEAESVLLFQDDYRETLNRQDVWNALSIEEKTAPAIDIPPEKEPCEIIEKVDYNKIPRRIRKSSLITTFIISMAAILFVALFLRFAPYPSVEVATLSSSMNAVFAGNESYPAGKRLTSRSNSLWLQKGAVEITFDYGAKVFVEAPAEFCLNSAENITLRSGRLYAHVPGYSKGFMVETPNSRVIDLGTEFAIKVNFDGTNDVYMMKGKASLIPGTKGRTGQAQILTAGNARHVNSQCEVQTIPMCKNEFIRGFLPERGLVWRGQDLDLADIVGGGCGVGNGRSETAIDPLTGQMLEWKLTLDRYGQAGDFYYGQGQYVPVIGSVFIDGVFVPDGGNGPIQVTSLGHRWSCPDTSNWFKYHIVNSLRIPDNPNQYEYAYPGMTVKEDMILLKASEGQVPQRLMGLMAAKTPPDSTDSSIFMHANLGITFDLSEIRKVLPNVRITKFKSVFGMGELALAPVNLDMWILVDSKPRLIKQNADSTTMMNIEIDLSQSDRFLTLVITDGGGAGYAFDWGLFMNPRLEIE